MNFAKLSVDRRLSVAALTVLIIIWGSWSYISLPRESMPDITIPMVFVMTNYKGVSPEDIESSITMKIEDKLKGLSDVKEISSVSREGTSQITIEFDTSVDIDEVLPKVKDKVDSAMGDLPRDLENDPTVFEVNLSEMPIMRILISGPLPVGQLKRLAEDLATDVESIPGVLEAPIRGGLEREIIIELDQDRMAAFGIPLSLIQGVVRGENQNTSAGSVRPGEMRYQLRVPGEIESAEELLDLVVSNQNEKIIRLQDIGTVIDGYAEALTWSKLNGQDSVAVEVKKRTGVNIVEIADKVKEKLALATTRWPEGVNHTIMMDHSKDIRNMVADLENNIITGFILVLIIIFISMGIRNAFLVSMSIPLSMLLAFIIIQAIGLSLNMVVLFSLTLSLGMLVDNGIVIVENIYRFMQQGVGRTRAVIRATTEVAGPIIASSLTTIAAFFPLLFWTGMMGEFMKFLPQTVIITLISCLFVALFINPALASMIMKLPRKSIKMRKAGTPKECSESDEIEDLGEKPVEAKGFFIIAYRNILGYSLNHRVSIVGSSFLVMFIMFNFWLISVGIERPIDFFPKTDPNSAFVQMDIPQGSDLDYVEEVANQILAKLDDRKGLEDIEHIYVNLDVISGQGGSRFENMMPNNIGIQFVDYYERKRPSPETVDEIRSRLDGITGAVITMGEEQGGPPTGAPINIEVIGPDFGVLSEISTRIQGELKKVPHVYDISDNLDLGSPTLMIKLNRERVAMMGLTTGTVGSIIRSAFSGVNVSTWRDGNDSIDIVVKMDSADRAKPETLNRLLLPTPDGGLVPLSDLATVEYVGGLGSIFRKNFKRTVTVRANVDETKVPGSVARANAEKFIGSIELPPEYQIMFTGQNEFQQDSQEFLGKAFIIAIALIAIVLITQFNSISNPIIILTSVILSLGGVFMGLAIHEMSFGIIMCGVGVISLAGVVVNNAIVLLDYISKLQERGYELTEAVISAGATRLRPVMLTAITTILGLCPMASGVSYDFIKMKLITDSDSSQMWGSMSISVIYGLMLATFLTLIVVPVLYHLFSTSGDRITAFRKKVSDLWWVPFIRIFGYDPRQHEDC